MKSRGPMLRCPEDRSERVRGAWCRERLMVRRFSSRRSPAAAIWLQRFRTLGICFRTFSSGTVMSSTHAMQVPARSSY